MAAVGKVLAPNLRASLVAPRQMRLTTERVLVDGDQLGRRQDAQRRCAHLAGVVTEDERRSEHAPQAEVCALLGLSQTADGAPHLACHCLTWLAPLWIEVARATVSRRDFAVRCHRRHAHEEHVEVIVPARPGMLRERRLPVDRVEHVAKQRRQPKVACMRRVPDGK